MRTPRPAGEPLAAMPWAEQTPRWPQEGRHVPVEILDVTGFVTVQHTALREHGTAALRTPVEIVYPWEAPNAP